MNFPHPRRTHSQVYLYVFENFIVTNSNRAFIKLEGLFINSLYQLIGGLINWLVTHFQHVFSSWLFTKLSDMQVQRCQIYYKDH